MWTGATKDHHGPVSTASTRTICIATSFDIVEACPRLDMILIPKVGVSQDVYAIDMLVNSDRSGERRARKRIGFEVADSRLRFGMANVESIAQSSRGLEALSFGVRRLRSLDARAHDG